MAALHARGELVIDQEFVQESIIGSLFKARILETTTVGGYPAVIPEVTGSAHLMAMNTIFIDPEDPHKHGFLLL